MHVEAKKSINRSKSEVLAEIRKSGNLENYHPFCAENETDKWPGIGSIDYVKYLNGLKYRREFIKWDDTGYVLNIGVKRKLARVEWLVEGNQKNSSLKIRVSPELPYKNPILIEGDLIILNKNLIGKATSIISEFGTPIINSYPKYKIFE